jgi:hypothetical protein
MAWYWPQPDPAHFAESAWCNSGLPPGDDYFVAAIPPPSTPT